MPYAIESSIFENDVCTVRHVFFGETEADAEKMRKHYLESCEYFRAAVSEKRVDEETFEVDRVPTPEDPDEFDDDGEDEDEDEPEDADDDADDEEDDEG